MKPDMTNLLGRLKSSYSHYQKGEDLTSQHPAHTMFIGHCKSVLDYIYYTPENLEVLQLLEIPKLEDLT